MKESPKAAPLSERDDLELVAELFYRQFDVLRRLTAQMLAATTLDDKLSLVVDAVTSELGYSHAAIALLDEEAGGLLIRMANGFPYDSDVNQMIVRGKFASPVEPATAGGRPLWIQRVNGGQDAELLDAIKSPTDLLALPLFGGRSVPTAAGDYWRAGVDRHPSTVDSRYIGTMYIGCRAGPAAPRR